MNDRWRDRQIADESHDADTLTCQAPGCPNAWSVSDQIGDKARGLCLAHKWGDARDWDRITVEQHRRAERRALDALQPKPLPPRLSKDDKRVILERAKAILSRPAEGSKDWAFALRDREKRGEKLTQAQSEAWRRAIPFETEEA